MDAVKRAGGRKKSSESLYADELGVTARKLRRMGGEARVRIMSPGARAIMLQHGVCGNSRTVHKGGLAARGMKKFVRGVVSQAERVA